jgi:hypothetical protein
MMRSIHSQARLEKLFIDRKYTSSNSGMTRSLDVQIFHARLILVDFKTAKIDRLEYT